MNRNVTNQIHGGLFMREYIEERTVELAQYIVENKATVRAAAKKFGISKSTVHTDVT
jgi:putative DeoR family transcriptional regulator (stage III sporulation protein D)